MEKRCNRCEKVKDINEFPLRSDNNKPRSLCRECKRIYDRELYENRTYETRQNKHKLKIDGKKKCNRCKEIKDISEFSVRSDNNKILWFCCRDCKRIYNREYHNKRSKEAKKNKQKKQKLRIDERRKWFCDYLSKVECKDCGEKNIIILTFDHLRDKKINISDMFLRGYSIKNMKEEIEKCEVVCSNCHMKRTARRTNSYKYRYQVK